MITLLVASALAYSPALRVPLPSEPHVVLALGAPTSSVAWRDARYGVSVDVAPSGSIAGASVGVRRLLVGEDTRFRLTVEADGGLLVPLIDPGVGLSVSGSIQAGWYGERGSGGGFALTSPLAFRFAPGAQARLPLLLEGDLAVACGPHLSLGALVGAGAAFAPGGPPAATAEASLVVGWR